MKQIHEGFEQFFPNFDWKMIKFTDKKNLKSKKKVIFLFILFFILCYFKS